MNIRYRLGRTGVAITLGIALALAAVVTTSNVPAHADSAPDLEVGDPAVDNASPYVDAAFTLSTTVTNAGGYESEGTTLNYYQSTDATIATTDTWVDSDSVQALTASGSSEESESISAPSTAGTYYYGACVEAVTDESDTTNNCSSSVTVTVLEPAGKPDLEVSVSVDDAKVERGTSFKLYATVTNAGDWEAHASILRYFQSTDATITTEDRQVTVETVDRLSAGGTGEEWARMTAPLRVGDSNYYGACIDAVTRESDTTDNCSAAVKVTAIDYTTHSDLQVGTPTVSDNTLATEAPFNLAVTVSNTGNRALQEYVTLRYYQSTDSTITSSDTEVATDTQEYLLHGRSENFSTYVFAPAASGTYYYGACIDSPTDGTESDATNNCSTGTTVTVSNRTAQNGPDMVVYEIKVSSVDVPPEHRPTLSAKVRNDGNEITKGMTLRFYRSADSTITTSDTNLTRFPFTRYGWLLIGGTSGASKSLEAQSESGTYYYGACVESKRWEIDTTNNCSSSVTVNVYQTDLTVSASANLSEVKPGRTFILTGKITNAGDADVKSSELKLRYYRSTDSTITTTDTEIESASAGTSLTQGSNSDTSKSFNAPSTTGTYYYGVCVDVLLVETDSSNNCSSAVELSVKLRPDLTILPSMGWTLPLAPGGSFWLSARLENEGVGTAAATTLRAYQSADSTVTTADTQVGTKAIVAHEPGDITHNRIDLTVPPVGTYYYGLCVDAVPDESDTSNNCTFGGAMDLVVPEPAPDLYIFLAEVSESRPLPGGAFTLSATVHNIGAEDAEATTLRYYQSTDDFIDTSDTELGTDDISALSSGSKSEQSIDLTAPTAPGVYYYGACVDTVTDEVDTDGNCSLAIYMKVTAASMSGSMTTSYAENGTGAVATYALGNTPSGSTVTWSLSGDDSGDFSISSEGVLTFSSSPDYESPADANTDNVYKVTIEATDGTNEGSLDVSVTVTDVNEGPNLNAG